MTDEEKEAREEGVRRRDPKRFPIEIESSDGPIWLSELKVMNTLAGYYIGRTCWNPEYGGFEEPYSRETGYMTREQAEKHLRTLSFEVRECIENEHGYGEGTLPRPKAN